ncbi:putative membrane protein (plasmid) [Pseudomonas cerasi]|nr:putative membrane protein [Pseudomonas cerasi]CZT26350.1 putative membrane protein [Pseudomonas cerasi]
MALKTKETRSRAVVVLVVPKLVLVVVPMLGVGVVPKLDRSHPPAVLPPLVLLLAHKTG